MTDLREAFGAFPRRRDQMLPLFHLAHRAQGYLDDEAIAEVARHVLLPKSEVYGIATGYSEFRRARPPTGEIAVCRGLTCLMAGADEVATGAMTAGFPVRRVECRFACQAAPVFEQEEKVFGPAEGTGILSTPGAR